MWGQLVEELLDAVLLAHRVHVRDLVVRQVGEVQVNLKRGKQSTQMRMKLDFGM